MPETPSGFSRRLSRLPRAPIDYRSWSGAHFQTGRPAPHSPRHPERFTPPLFSRCHTLVAHDFLAQGEEGKAIFAV
jgi:hypothetical protein